MIPRTLLSVIFAAGIAFGQLSTNSVTVTATRNVNIQPDQVIFRVTVDAPLDVSRDEVIAAVSSAGITAANFSGVGTVQPYDPQTAATKTLLEWSFQFPAATSSMKSTIAMLSAVQIDNARKDNGLSISFGVVGTQLSPQAQQGQACAISDLLADARAQAQKMATAAGVSLGAVLAMQSAVITTDPGGLFASPVVAPVCSLTVKFALGAF